MLRAARNSQRGCGAPHLRTLREEKKRGVTLIEANLISIVDDDESVRDSMKILLRSVGHRVATFTSAAELLLDSVALKKTECLILDVRMPGMDGLELQRRMNAAHSCIPIIFVTAHDDEIRRQQAIAAGAVDFLCKPYEASTLLAAVQGALSGRENLSQPAGSVEKEAPDSR